MKKVFVLGVILLMGVMLMAQDLYKEGFKKGYQDGVMRVVYFVSPTQGQPAEWVKGYKDGHQKGLKVKLDGQISSLVNTESLNTVKTPLKKDLEDVLNLYGVASYADDETAYDLYKEASVSLSKKIIDNFDGILEEVSENGADRGEYLNQYVDYLGQLDYSQRDAYQLTNKRLVEFFENKYLWAKDNGSRLEMKLYEDGLKKVQFLVGRGA